MKVKEFYKTVNQIGRWIHKPIYILRLSSPDREDAIEMTIDEIVNIINEKVGDFWVMIKGSKYYAPSDLPEINDLIKAIKEKCGNFILLYQDAMKSTKHIEGYDYLELFLREPTQENINKAATLHNKVGDTVIYLNTRHKDEVINITNYDYPNELGLLYALPLEDTSYINRAIDMNRIAFLLPSSRWQTTVRMYTIMKDGGYFPEFRNKFISFLTGNDPENLNYVRKESILRFDVSNMQ